MQSEKEKAAELAAVLPEVSRWMQQFDELDSMKDDKYITDRINREPAVAQKLIQLKLTSSQWITTLDRTHSAQPFWTIFMDKYRRFLKFYDIAAAVVCTCKIRKAPFNLSLVGSPGIGKTHMGNHLIKALYSIFKRPFDPATDVFSRPQDSPFWEGYRNQPVVYYNDLFQTTDLTIRKAVAQEFISMSQTAPMPLNMAEATMKGRMFFDSEVVLSDMNFFPTEQALRALVTSPGAVIRRFANHITVDLKQNWAVLNRDNVMVFNSAMATRPFHSEAYTFTLGGVVYEWLGLLTELTRRWNTHIITQERNILPDTGNLDDDIITAIRVDAGVQPPVIPEQRINMDLVEEVGNNDQFIQDLQAETNPFRNDLTGNFTDDIQFDLPRELQFDEMPAYMNTHIPYQEFEQEQRSEPSFFSRMINKIPSILNYLPVKILLYLACTTHGRTRMFFMVLWMFLVSPIRALPNRISRLKYIVQNKIPSMDATKQFIRGAVSYIDSIRKMKCIFVILVIGSLLGVLFALKFLFKFVFDTIVSVYNWFRPSVDSESSEPTQPRNGPLKRNNINIESSEPNRITHKPLNRKMIDIESSEPTQHKTTPLGRNRIQIEGSATSYSSDARANRIKRERNIIAEGSMSLAGMNKNNTVVGSTDNDQHAHLNEFGTHVDKHHFHICQNCNQTYTHTHLIKTVLQSSTYPIHFCPPCSKATPRISASGIFEEGNAMPGADALIYKFSNSQVRLDCDGTNINGFFVGSRILCVPNHFFTNLDPEASFKMSGPNYVHTFPHTDFSDFVVDKTKDIRLISISNARIPAKIALKKYLNSSKDRISATAALINPKLYTGDGRILDRHSIMNLKETTTLNWSEHANQGLRENVRNGLSYTANTMAGDCGALLTQIDSTGVLRIIGMHIAGSFGQGVSTRITSEAIERLINELRTTYGITEQKGLILNDPNEVPGNNLPLCMDDNINIIGNLPNHLIPILAQKTSIAPSRLHGLFEPITKPAMLRMTNDIDPFRNGVIKMARKNVSLDYVILDEVVSSVGNDLLSMDSSNKHESTLLTDHEILNGVKGDKWILPMNVKSSPGWPFKLTAKLPGKLDFVTGEPGNYMANEQMITEMNDLENSYASGDEKAFLFFDCIKDERKPIEKADAGNSRIFSIAPMHFNMLMRKYTAHFQAHCMTNSTTCGSAVGINPHSPEWGALLRRLSQVGDNYIAGDYEKWDKWVPYELFMGVCKIANRFYGDKEGSRNAKIRTALFANAFGAIRIALGNVYSTNGGMPSGISGTAVFNSIANQLLFKYAFICLKEIHQPRLNMIYFSRLIQFTAYGDDHICAVSDLIPWFNMITLSDFYRTIGVGYTSADKSSKTFTMPYVPLDDLTYLKRNFDVLDDFHVLAPLDKTVICESIMWTRKGNQEDNILISTCASALLEAVHHGKPWFNWLDRIISDELIGLNVSPPEISYKGTYSRLMGDGIDPIGSSMCSDLGLVPDEN